MHGPTAATTRARAAPSPTMASTVASITPASAPRQPAWAAPITPASASASSTGAQSAESTPSVMCGRSVTSASACTLGRFGCGARARTTTAPCTWRTVHRLAGAIPRRCSARARFASTRAISSPLE